MLNSLKILLISVFMIPSMFAMQQGDTFEALEEQYVGYTVLIKEAQIKKVKIKRTLADFNSQELETMNALASLALQRKRIYLFEAHLRQIRSYQNLIRRNLDELDEELYSDTMGRTAVKQQISELKKARIRKENSDNGTGTDFSETEELS